MDDNPLLLFLEGTHDIQFLKRLSAILHTRDPGLPDLGSCEQKGRVILVPIGGGGVYGWADRFAPLHWVRRGRWLKLQQRRETIEKESGPGQMETVISV